jgi:hypothetical protein
LVLRGEEPARQRVVTLVAHDEGARGAVVGPYPEADDGIGAQVADPISALTSAREQEQPAAVVGEPDLDRVRAPGLTPGRRQVAELLGGPLRAAVARR